MDRDKAVNFDNSIQMGVYYINDDPISAIGNPGIKYGVLVVFPSIAGHEIYTTQIAFEMFSPFTIYDRTASAKNGFSDVPWNRLR